MHSINHTSDKVRDIFLHPAMESDAGFITSLSELVFSIYGPYGEILPHWLCSQENKAFMARLDDTQVGFAMIGNYSMEDDLSLSAEIMAIAVLPEYHNMGIGGMLLRKVEETAARLHIRILFLHTAIDNLKAQRLFLHRGYGLWRQKKKFYHGGQDAFLMAKMLGSLMDD